MTRRLFAAAMMTAVFLALPGLAAAQKLVFVVRHAERADGGSGSMGADPALSAAGEARAVKLAVMLADAGITRIYATEFKRTQDTAKPLAAKLRLAVQARPAADTAGLVSAIKAGRADVVLVVGHSNTVPAILKAFGGPDITMGDDEYDSLFIIVPATGAMTRIRF